MVGMWGASTAKAALPASLAEELEAAVREAFALTEKADTVQLLLHNKNYDEDTAKNDDA
jgi:hypothetical protein